MISSSSESLSESKTSAAFESRDTVLQRDDGPLRKFENVGRSMSSESVLSGRLLGTVCQPHHNIDHRLMHGEVEHAYFKKVKVAHTRLPSVRFRSWSRFLAVSLQVMWVINPAVGCHYFPLGLQLPPQPLRGLLPILLLGEQRHNRCEQFAYDCYPTATWTRALLHLSPARWPLGYRAIPCILYASMSNRPHIQAEGRTHRQRVQNSV